MPSDLVVFGELGLGGEVRMVPGAERRLAVLPAGGRQVRPLLLQWTNRLSDLLWLLARQAETPSPGA